MNAVLRIAVNALALAAAVWLVPALTITTSSGLAASVGTGPATAVAFAVLAILFGLVNAVIRPILAFFATPLTCLTLGLFTLVINAAMLALTAWLSQFTPFQLGVGGFWSAVIAALIVSVVSAVLGWFLPDRERSRD
ncbi:phage holin family protein [Brevibacterium sp. 5221]|uniref:Phage holin family protein n=1 Tax=Brevibacterium rongguiense TaxID=2695267 RepID=A0A6N9H5D7_9MICO|nr:phage holin family protein [Brevibacterium rongguiense]MYM19103.1 phage holin family protein [Brevibacterium rongguiense]